MKRKKTFLLIGLLIIVISMLAQKPIFLDDTIGIGKSICTVRYSVSIVDDIDNLEKKNTDFLVLEIGLGLSRCHNYNLFLYDSCYTVCMKQGRNSYPSPKGVCFPEEILKRFQTSELTVHHRMPDKSIYQYEEEIPNWQWHLFDETIEILDYPCKKATCFFRGRLWMAWFTERIPLNDGPWKFCGLPGLILKVEDEKGHYSFTCESVENATDVPIVTYDKFYYTPITREQMYRELKHIYADWYAYLRMLNGGRVIAAKRGENGKVTFEEVLPDVKKMIPYNPIELE